MLTQQRLAPEYQQKDPKALGEISSALLGAISMGIDAIALPDKLLEEYGKTQCTEGIEHAERDVNAVDLRPKQRDLR